MSPAIIFIITAAAFGLVIGLMAVGVMLGRRQISGSCGGLGQSAERDEDGQPSCSLCSAPDATCQELGRRMEGQTPAGRHGGDQGCEQDCEAEGCSKEEIDACKGR